jgi:hypothetical protein
MLADLLVTGDPLHSLTGTQSNAESLGRITGLTNVPLTAPRRIGEILREPVLLAAAGGGVMSLLWLGRRAWLGAAVGVLAMAAFCVLAAAGLPILGRYLLLPAAILAVFAGAGVFGWRELRPGDGRRVWWSRFAALSVVVLAVLVPPQVDRVRDLRHALAVQDGIQDDLRALVRNGVFGPPCRTITVPNHRPVPLLALWLDVPPRRIASALEQQPEEGVSVRPATPAVARDYILDPRDRVQQLPPVPPRFNPVGGNRSWRVYKRCAPDVVAEHTE